MVNRVDPVKTAPYEPFHQDLHCKGDHCASSHLDLHCWGDRFEPSHLYLHCKGDHCAPFHLDPHCWGDHYEPSHLDLHCLVLSAGLKGLSRPSSFPIVRSNAVPLLQFILVQSTRYLKVQAAL